MNDSLRPPSAPLAIAPPSRTTRRPLRAGPGPVRMRRFILFIYSILFSGCFSSPACLEFMQQRIIIIWTRYVKK